MTSLCLIHVTTRITFSRFLLGPIKRVNHGVWIHRGGIEGYHRKGARWKVWRISVGRFVIAACANAFGSSGWSSGVNVDRSIMHMVYMGESYCLWAETRYFYPAQGGYFHSVISWKVNCIFKEKGCKGYWDTRLVWWYWILVNIEIFILIEGI